MNDKIINYISMLEEEIKRIKNEAINHVAVNNDLQVANNILQAENKELKAELKKVRKMCEIAEKSCDTACLNLAKLEDDYDKLKSLLKL